MQLPLLFPIFFLVLGSLTAWADSAAVLDQYTELSGALASDNLEAAKTAAATLRKTVAGDEPEMAEAAEKVVASDSLKTARAAFKPLSVEAVKLAEGQDDYFIMTCPMAKADWVQKERQIANPYYGAAMLRCGSVKK